MQIQLSEGPQEEISLDLGWALHATTGSFTREGWSGGVIRLGHRKEGHMSAETQSGLTHPETKKHQGFPEAVRSEEKGMRGFSGRGLEGTNWEHTLMC